MIRPEIRTTGAFPRFLAGLLSAIAIVPAGAQSTAPGEVSKPADRTGGLTVSPLRVELASQDRAQTITVNNGFDAPLAVQARIFTWTQVDGKDVYTPSADHTVTPSIVMIPSGESQLVRVLRKAPAGNGEKAYRLVLDQLPDGSAAQQTGTRSRVRFVLPMFVDRDRAAPSKIVWRLDDTGLTLANEGGSTARIVEIVMKRASGVPITLPDSNLRYVLGTASIKFPISRACSLGRVRIFAQIDGEPIDVEPASTCS